MRAEVSTGARRQLGALARSQPEAGAWLALVEAALTEGEQPVWGRAAAALALRAGQPGTAPLLAGATILVEGDGAAAWLRRLLGLAGSAGPEAAPFADAANARGLDALALLEAAVNQDAARLAAIAAGLGVGVEALAAVAQLAAIPLLHACRRRLAGAVAADWHEGYCPVCGAWPVVAESRGLERARRLRCGRCGGDWGMAPLRCPFCGTTDHAQLAALVAEGEGEARKVETCRRCRGYLKTLTTLRAWAGDEVCLADLATVDLDLAAIEREFVRPEAPAVALGLRLVASPAGVNGAR